ncbi:ABC transporter substrate-binding protein [Tepidibacillus infernus]|uniref:ABC transporter substrate-binding protein n=1 Tax=Tepidibacillus decaturensis TaxID=1413211 RepID=A0A135L5R0_9BACI|nr:ABC transporter substrate-binding protein [Tepidibacillus decaturensis]KXG44301.1 hypothetical protein U473_10000 [Tepidibacillus decaturensis]
MKKMIRIILIVIGIILFSFWYIQSSNELVNTKEKYKIGVLISGTERIEKIKGLKEGLQNLGYVEGMNTSFVIKNADNQIDLIKKYANELDAMDLDVIIAGGAIETKFFKENSRGKTPIIFLGVADAIQLNLVESYQKPNGRLTGVENGHVELSGKRLQLFKLLLPSLNRIIVIYDEKIDASLLSLEKVKQVSEKLQIGISPIPISNLEQLKELKSFSFQENDGILVLPSYFLEKASLTIGQLALERNIPTFGVQSSDIKNGFLLSYGVSYYDQGFQCASTVSQILHGQSAGSIPVEKPDTVRLLVNAKTERALNIEFSKIGNAFIQRIE